ncbi:MAG: glycosyltransferase family 4 protein [Actinobacteria bacterium]|nr:glycosyltransferase family 4 protein [Actinomycetota bacterium]
MRVCLVYDHLYPATIGGGERWMHDLALALARSGHEVTYLTMRHWDEGPPVLPGVEIVGLVKAGAVYAEERRTLGPPARFGFAVGRYLARHGRRFDVVHTAAFPFFPLLAAAVVRRRAGFRLVADWYEVWTRRYWQRYAGRLVGTVGWLVQRGCIRTRHRAFCISRLTERRLREEGFRGESSVLPGLYAGPVEPSATESVEPLVVYAGRIVGEKRLGLLVRAVAEARRHVPELRLEIIGDGPDRERAERETASLGLGEHVCFRGRRPQEEVEAAFGRASCVATASEREGYGLIVVEASARGTPSVVVAGEENAAAELIVPGVNGLVAEPSADSLGSAIVEVIRLGAPLRDSTLAWFAEHADELTLERSLEVVTASYAVVNR